MTFEINTDETPDETDTTPSSVSFICDSCHFLNAFTRARVESLDGSECGHCGAYIPFDP